MSHRIIVAATLAVALSLPATGTQHLVSPGDNWERLASRLRPGDEVILLPGRHASASFGDLHGTSNEPIVIRGFSAEHPATIAALNFGIELVRPQFVILRDLKVESATKCGISISGRGEDRTLGEPWYAGVRIQRVAVSSTGDYEDGIAIQIDGIRQCMIEDLTCDGWGAVGLDIVASSDITIERALFSGAEGFEQTFGVRIRGGSHTVIVSRSQFRAITDAPVSIGGSSFRSEFPERLMSQAEAQAVFEAAQVTLSQCLIEGGMCGVRVASSSRCAIQACTIVDQQYWSIRLDEDKDSEPLARTRGLQVAQSLFTSAAEDFETPFRIDGELADDALALEDNLWWFPSVEPMELAGQVLFPQVVMVDPLLDGNRAPGSAAARQYGAAALRGLPTDQP